MAIISEQTAPNFAKGNYHRLLKATLFCADADPYWEMLIGHYASEEAREKNPNNPMYVNIVSIPTSSQPNDPRAALYIMAMQLPVFSENQAVSDASEADEPASVPPLEEVPAADDSSAPTTESESENAPLR